MCCYTTDNEVVKHPPSVLLTLKLLFFLAGVFITVTPDYVLGSKNLSVDDNIAGKLFCRLIGSTYFLFLFGKGSTLTVMCLAIERWFSVVKPLRYKYAFKRGRILLYIAIIWAFSCFTQINELFIMKTSHGTCIKGLPPYSKEMAKILTLLHILATFFVPSVVTWVTFAQVWFHARRAIHHGTRLSNYERAKQKLIRMCALTAFLLTVCWFPAEMFFILKEFNVITLSLTFYQFTDMLAMSNSCFNPWVYFLYNQEYKRAFLSLFSVKMRRPDNRTTTFKLGQTATKSPSVILTRQVNIQSETELKEIN